MYKYRLSSIVFKDATEITPNRVTVLVGPNNAGKSQILKDISFMVTGRSPARGSVVVKEVNWTLPGSIAALRESYTEVERGVNNHGKQEFRILQPELVEEFLTTGGPEWPSGFEESYQNVGDKKEYFAAQFGRAMTVHLTTEHRLQVTREAASPSRDSERKNLLQYLYRTSPETEKLLSEIVHEIFGTRIALDFYTTPARLRLRVGDDFSHLPVDPRAGREVMASFDLLDLHGDGIRAFLGVLVPLLAVQRPLLLIDEPELFLPPPLAFRMGSLIAENTSGERQVVIATHSADLLRGLVTTTDDMSVIRIDRIGNRNSVTQLSSERLRQLTSDPLLSSARVLDGLFYPGVLVVEGDTDARFFLAATKKYDRTTDLHVVKADNKQTVGKVVELYREMYVRSAGVVDFDVLNDGADFRKQLAHFGIPEPEWPELLETRAAIAESVGDVPAISRLEDVQMRLQQLQEEVKWELAGTTAIGRREEAEREGLLRYLRSRLLDLSVRTKGWQDLKESGRAALPGELGSKFDKLYDRCSGDGLFIIPTGELESILAAEGIRWTRNKKRWFRLALLKLPELTVSTERQPWRLVKEITEYLASV